MEFRLNQSVLRFDVGFMYASRMRFAITSAPKITASPGKSFDASAKKAAPKTTAFVAIAGNQFLNTDFGAAKSPQAIAASRGAPMPSRRLVNVLSPVQ